MWSRPPGFATLALIILEQQVSLASARAAFARLRGVVGPVTAANVAAAVPSQLRAAGLTRQKTAYLQEAACAVAGGHLRLAALARMDDAGVHEALTAVKGIGRWSADVWLLMVLRRPDPWPVGDRALQVAARRLWQLPVLPGQDELARLGEPFRPYRAVAARLLWHYYLQAGK